MASESGSKRWYDSRPIIKVLTDTLSAMPDQLQFLMGDALLWSMIRERKVNTKGIPYTSIGAAKVIGLHQSKKRRRRYDQNQELHEAMSAFYLLSAPDQNFIAESMWELITFVQRYYAACFLVDAPVDMEMIKTIAKTCATKGIVKAQEVVQEIIQNTQAQHNLPPAKPTAQMLLDAATEEGNIPLPPVQKPKGTSKRSSFGSRFRD
jgi:hypothetical protein